MKRILLIILTLALCLTVFSGCTPKQFKNLNESEIKSVSVTTSPEFYGYEYSFTGEDGMTWVIEIEYEDESETTVYLFGDEIWINAKEKYLMQSEENGVFEALLEALKQKQ